MPVEFERNILLKKLRWPKDSNGFSLVEILVATVIFGISSLLIVSTLNTLKNTEVTISRQLDVNEVSASLAKFLSNQKNCKNALTGVSGPGPSEAPLEVKNYTGVGAPSNKILKKGVTIPSGTNLKGILITDLTIKDKGIPPYDVNLNGALFTRKYAQVRLDLSTTVSGQTHQYQKYIEFPVLVSLANKIAHCGVEGDTSAVCAALGGIFNQTANTCNVSTGICEYKGMSYGCSPWGACPNMSSNPSASKVNLPASLTAPTGSMCPRGGNPTSTGSASYGFIGLPCGKGGCTPYSNSVYFYICLQCN
jgi:prepilin-type N-terminal cleavage/methylation domain-containing protein